MGEDILYFDFRRAIVEHDNILRISGGKEGIIHPGLLESCLEFIKNELYYPSFEEKLTHLVFSLAQNHIFEDGNKRSAIALGAYFLQINGYGLLVGTFISEMENIVVWVAESKISKDELRIIVFEIITMNKLSEETKLSLVRSLE
jgi:death-on-curing protein